MSDQGAAIQLLFQAKADLKIVITALDELVQAKKAALELSRETISEEKYYKAKTRLLRQACVISELRQI